jgi:Dual specificity phosphatase, catalytic domain
MSSRMGISRSATVVAAYLTFRHGLTPFQAIAWIRMQRPIIHPNSGFQEQLADYYSVLQMDHGEDFGWKGLSMCEHVRVDEEREQKKRQKRQYMEKVRRKWKNENVEWVNCSIVGWSEDIEWIVQKHITGAIA